MQSLLNTQENNRDLKLWLLKIYVIKKKKVYLTCTVTVKKQAKILTLVEAAPIYLKFTSVLLDIIWAY